MYQRQPPHTKLHLHGQRASNINRLHNSQKIKESSGGKYMYEEHPPVNKQIVKKINIHFPLLELTLARTCR